MYKYLMKDKSLDIYLNTQMQQLNYVFTYKKDAMFSID